MPFYGLIVKRMYQYQFVLMAGVNLSLIAGGSLIVVADNVDILKYVFALQSIGGISNCLTRGPLETFFKRGLFIQDYLDCFVTNILFTVTQHC